MKKLITKYRQQKGSKKSKLGQLFLIFALVLMYTYFVAIWKPATFVTILGADPKMVIIRALIVIIFSVVFAIKLDLKFYRREYDIKRQIKDLEMWNKFILHFAFLKTGSSEEKNQVIDTLKYLEDSGLKTELEIIYEETESLKEAHAIIYERYPYPQIKTFFSEAENAIVNGGDENKLMQKTALNIDKYINDLLTYEEEKKSAYKTSVAIISIVIALIAVTKVVFANVVVGFISTVSGFVIMLILTGIMINLLIDAKARYTSTLSTFGGEDNE